MSSTGSARRSLDDVRVNVKTALAALWVALMFCYVYADILGFYRAENVEGVLAGRIGGVDITPALLVGSALLMAGPIAMTVLSLTLPARANRWLNLVAGVGYGVVLAATTLTGELSERTAYYLVIALAEAVLLVLIVVRAWRWPAHGDGDDAMRTSGHR